MLHLVLMHLMFQILNAGKCLRTLSHAMRTTRLQLIHYLLAVSTLQAFRDYHARLSDQKLTQTYSHNI